jgi:hypothetical protein
MEREPAEFDCESILQMLRETPDAAEVIIDMIRDLDEFDENCVELIMAMQRTGVDVVHA